MHNDCAAFYIYLGTLENILLSTVGSENEKHFVTLYSFQAIEHIASEILPNPTPL